MVCKTVNSALWKFLAARFAGMLVSVARIVELRTSIEVAEDQRYEVVSELMNIEVWVKRDSENKH